MNTKLDRLIVEFECRVNKSCTLLNEAGYYTKADYLDLQWQTLRAEIQHTLNELKPK